MCQIIDDTKQIFFLTRVHKNFSINVPRQQHNTVPSLSFHATYKPMLIH